MKKTILLAVLALTLTSCTAHRQHGEMYGLEEFTNFVLDVVDPVDYYR